MLERTLLLSMSIVLVLTCYDLSRLYLNPTTTEMHSASTPSSANGDPSTYDQNNRQSEFPTNPPSDIKIPKMKMQTIPTVRFLYCQNSGYRNVFEQFAQLVRTHHPGLSVVGDNYPPPPAKALLVRVISILKMVLLVCLLFGQNPFTLFNLPSPAVFSWALQNKMSACLIIFFFFNSLESYLISTGAFEISVNDVPLWSKLETGRLPSPNEFIQMLQPFNSGPDQTNVPHATF